MEEPTLLNSEEVVPNSKPSVSLSVALNKPSYFPGEEMTGYLYLKANPSINNPLFLNALANVTILQIYSYEYEPQTIFDQIDSTISSNKEYEEHIIYSTTFNFHDYLGKNLVNGLQIPFTIFLPDIIEPSFYYKKSFIKHILNFDFAGFNCKNSIGLLIKNPRYFNEANKNLKEPLKILRDIIKTKMFFINQGKIAIYIFSKSNSYLYGTAIPLEIKIDASELDLFIQEINVNFDRIINFNDKQNKNNIKFTIKKNLFNQLFKVNQQNKNFSLNLIIPSPTDDFVADPKLIYDLVEANYRDINYIPSVDILPFCIGGIINCLYVINVKINFDSTMTSNEEFIIPIEFYLDNNNGVINVENKNKEKNIIEKNNIEKKVNEENNHGFEIIDDKDFMKSIENKK